MVFNRIVRSAGDELGYLCPLVTVQFVGLNEHEFFIGVPWGLADLWV
jgi:hypothetical protein